MSTGHFPLYLVWDLNSVQYEKMLSRHVQMIQGGTGAACSDFSIA